jgi:hypothetical protein
MLEQPLNRLDANLGGLERMVPGLKASIEELKRVQSGDPPLRTPEEFRHHAEKLATVEEKCCEAIVGFVKLAEHLVTTFQNAQNVARYMPEEGADPHPAWWKRGINALLPYGGTKRAMNTVVGSAAFLAGFVWTGSFMFSLLTSQTAFLAALLTGPAGLIPLLILYFAISLASAITGIIGGGVATYAYGACHVVFDKCVAPMVSRIGSLIPGLGRIGSWIWPWKSSTPEESSRVEMWKASLNAAFAAAKDRSMRIFSDVDTCLRNLTDLRANVSTLCTNARAICADEAKRSDRNPAEWKKEDDELYGESVQSDKDTRENEELLERFDGLQKLTEGVTTIDPLSWKDLVNRGFHASADVCGIVKRLGEAHFIYPNGMPAGQPWKSIYILLGLPSGILARFGAFAQALASDGEKPIRMLHELLGIVLAKMRVKKQEGITMKHLMLAAFNNQDLKKHGPLYYVSGAVTDIGLGTFVKTIPLIERANELRELSPDTARHLLGKKMGNVEWGKHATRSTIASVTGIVGDAASVAGATLMNGLRRMFQMPRQRLVAAENRARVQSVHAETALAEVLTNHPELQTHASQTNAQLGDDIRTQIKALRPGDALEASRIEILIEYWERRLHAEECQREQLRRGHTIELHDIHEDLPAELADLSRTRNPLVEFVIQTFEELPRRLENRGKDRNLLVKSYYQTLKALATATNAVLEPVGNTMGRMVEVLATPLTGGSHFLTVSSGDKDPRALAKLAEINRDLARPMLPPPFESSSGAIHTLIGSTPIGALLILHTKASAEGGQGTPQLTLIPPEEADAFIQRHIAECRTPPSALLSDEASLQILARHAVGRPGTLPRTQRDALRQIQIAGDTSSAGPRMQSLYSKAEREGFTGPDEIGSVPGLQKLFSGLRKRTEGRKNFTGLVSGDA